MLVEIETIQGDICFINPAFVISILPHGAEDEATIVTTEIELDGQSKKYLVKGNIYDIAYVVKKKMNKH